MEPYLIINQIRFKRWATPKVASTGEVSKLIHIFSQRSPENSFARTSPLINQKPFQIRFESLCLDVLRLKVRILSAFYISSHQPPFMILVMQLFQRINHRSDPILQLLFWRCRNAISALFLSECLSSAVSGAMCMRRVTAIGRGRWWMLMTTEVQSIQR